MCGLVAALTGRRVDAERLGAGLRMLAHRGPDEHGVWMSADRRLGLGHVRLSVVGVTNGTQPMSTATGDVHAVVNGELYGHAAVRAELESAGYGFNTQSDSEIALHLYLRHGLEFVHRLRGEYAVVIADERDGRLVAVRDRFGIKPLYYAVHDGEIVFASEIKALLAMGVPARWDTQAFFAECHGVRRADRTLFAGIYAVPPGSVAIATNGRVDVSAYWDFPFPTAEALREDHRDDAEIVAGFRDVLEDAVAERLVADVEVACYLSGGIDSSAVLGLAQQYRAEPIRAFTVVFDERAYDEGDLARRTAQLVGATLHPVPVTQADLAESFSAALWHAETLVVNGHGVAKYLLSKAVRDAGIKVVLTGEGSDEILAGYPPFRRDLLLHHGGGQDPETVARLVTELAAANASSRGLLTADGAPAPGLEVLEHRLGFVPSALEAFSSSAAKTYLYLRPGYLEAGPRANPYAELLDNIDVSGRLSGRDPVNQSLYLWSRTALPNYILTYLGDRMEMAHSVEGRLPFLDHEVVEYVTGLPVRHKIRGLREKHVLREAVRDRVLPEIYDRQKFPFMSPPSRTDDALVAFCQDVLRSAVVDDQPFFEPRLARRLLDDVAGMDPEERAATESVVLRIVSTCVLQELFAPAA